MIKNGRIVCDSCLETIKVAKMCKIFTTKKTIENWDVCEKCCKRRGW
jgi:hypothetical protein